jgi:hypothetical protein
MKRRSANALPRAARSRLIRLQPLVAFGNAFARRDHLGSNGLAAGSAQPPSDLSRRVSLVSARRLGVNAEQPPRIGTDPDLFDAFYSEHLVPTRRS